MKSSDSVGYWGDAIQDCLSVSAPKSVPKCSDCFQDQVPKIMWFFLIPQHVHSIAGQRVFLLLASFAWYPFFVWKTTLVTPKIWLDMLQRRNKLIILKSMFTSLLEAYPEGELCKFFNIVTDFDNNLFKLVLFTG